MRKLNWLRTADPRIALFLLMIAVGACQKDTSDTPSLPSVPTVTVDTCSNVQARLDAGERPWAIAETGVSYECLYGKLYFDGIIYFVDTVLDYARLVTRPDEEVLCPWACEGIMGADGWDVGEAEYNSDRIFLNCDSGAYFFSGSKFCRTIDHGHGDSTLWMLPTRGDLFQMHDNLATRGLGGFGADTYYWSSSEHVSPILYAWAVNVSNTANGSVLKTDFRPCRCNLAVQN